MRRGFEADHFAVADHAASEEGSHVDRDLQRDGEFGRGVILPKKNYQRERRGHRERDPDGAKVPARVIKADYKGEKVKAEGQHPEKGNYRDVLAHLVGCREKENGTKRSESAPKGAVNCRWWWIGFGDG